MKIGIDTFGCNHSQSGAGSYLLNCISNFVPQKDLEIVFFGHEIDKFTYVKEEQSSFVSVNIKDNLRSEQKWHKRKIKRFCKKNNFDLVIFAAYEKILPIKVKSKSIAIMNSIASNAFLENGKKYKKRFLKGLKNVSKIVVGTKFLKDDLMSFCVPSEKIAIIHSGIDHKLFFPFVNPDDEYININPFAIKRPYFVYASQISNSDKKHIQLIKAFEIFKKNTNQPHRLVIAGSDGDYAEDVHKSVLNSPFASDIFLTGYFPHDSFANLYAGASACVFPSVNEGVGLPILEAMACGIPVLCSNKGALKEVGGDVPLYFDSDDENDIAEAMQKIVEDDDLRKKMIESGLKKASSYNWKDTITQILEIAKNL